MRRVLQILSSHTWRVLYVGNSRLQIALLMSNRDNLSCLRRHKTVAKTVVSRATNWSDLFPSALGCWISSSSSLWASSPSASLPLLSSTLHPLLVGTGHKEKDCWQNKISQGRGLQEAQKDFCNFYDTHSINPSLAAHFFPHCSLGLCPLRLRVCQRMDSVADLGNVSAEWL